METNWFHYISYINFPTSYRNLILSSTLSVRKRGKWGSAKVSQQATRTAPLQNGSERLDAGGRPGRHRPRGQSGVSVVLSQLGADPGRAAWRLGALFSE